jgi:hypothetical protein
VRYRYTADPDGNGTLRAAGSGERLTLTGWKPYNFPPPRATQIVSFAPPNSTQAVFIPLALPSSTPRMEYIRGRVIYNYGSDTVEVRFLKDGSAEVIYDSGLLRAP